MAENAKECGLRKLRERVERLNELIQLAPNKKGVILPGIIIAHEVALIMRAATLYCPESMGKVLADNMRESIYRNCNFCVKCGNQIESSDTKRFNSGFWDHCSKCRNKIKKGLLVDDIEAEGQNGTAGKN